MYSYYDIIMMLQGSTREQELITKGCTCSNDNFKLCILQYLSNIYNSSSSAKFLKDKIHIAYCEAGT